MMTQPAGGDPFGAQAYAPPAPPPAAPGPAPVPGGAKADPAGRRALAGFLVSYQDDPMGKFWPLWQGKNSVGRADTGQKVEIEIAHGTTSTHHATIECDPQRFILTDLGSTNGTFHNEEAIGFQGKRELRDGDKIRFGGYSVMVVNVVART
jgi:pSer/pThr/pTyr-binding forkhead associated (FHA) protein